MVTPRAFADSLQEPAPPAGLSIPLLALWWTGRQAWDKAHVLVMGDSSAAAAWVHAHLHRIEGDLSNADYWYRRAGRSRPSASLQEEWQEMAAALLRH